MPARPPLRNGVIGVLVVEDEPIPLMDTAAVFTSANMAVFEARYADEAMAILIARDDIQVVITDLGTLLGSMGGREFVHCIAARWPEIGVVVLSGADLPRQGELPDGVRCVRKPCRGPELVNGTYAIASRQTGSI